MNQHLIRATESTKRWTNLSMYNACFGEWILCLGDGCHSHLVVTQAFFSWPFPISVWSRGQIAANSVINGVHRLWDGSESVNRAEMKSSFDCHLRWALALDVPAKRVQTYQQYRHFWCLIYTIVSPNVIRHFCLIETPVNVNAPKNAPEKTRMLFSSIDTDMYWISNPGLQMGVFLQLIIYIP